MYHPYDLYRSRRPLSAGGAHRSAPTFRPVVGGAL